MRFLVLSAAVLSALSAKAVLSAAPGNPGAAAPAASALTELQRAVGALGTETAAAGAAGKPQEASFSKVAAAAAETKAGVRVPLTSGKDVQLKNVAEEQVGEGEAITYHYRAAEPKTGLVWVSQVPYECPTELLVSRMSGRVTNIGNEPHLNAPGTLLFARQNGCFMVFEDYYPGFGLWRVQNGQLKLLKQVRLDNYFVLAGRWVGPSRLRLELGLREELAMLESGGENKVRRQAFELTVK